MDAEQQYLDFEVSEHRESFCEARGMLDALRCDNITPAKLRVAQARYEEESRWLMDNDPDHAAWAKADAKAQDQEFNEMLEQGVI